MKAFETEAFFITFNNKYEANLIKEKIRDGIVIINDGGIPKLFYVDQTKPLYLTIKKGLFNKERLPLYIIKWNSVIPYNIEDTNNIKQPAVNRKLPKPKGIIAEPLDPEHPEQIMPEFKDFEGDKTPEYVAKLIDLKIMSNLLGRGNKANFVWIAVALIIGAIIGYLFYKTQVGR